MPAQSCTLPAFWLKGKHGLENHFFHVHNFAKFSRVSHRRFSMPLSSLRFLGADWAWMGLAGVPCALRPSFCALLVSLVGLASGLREEVDSFFQEAGKYALWVGFVTVSPQA